MKKQLLFCMLSLGGMTACQPEADVVPNATTLSGEVAGSYRTNAFLDLSCVALPTGQMPSVDLRAETDSTVTVRYTRYTPDRVVQQLSGVTLRRQAEAVQLRLADSSIGTLQTDRIFTNSGMEKQGKLLRISLQNSAQQPALLFSGYRE